MQVGLFTLNPDQWAKNGSNLERLALFNQLNNNLFGINPATISSLGGTKTSKLSDANFLSLRFAASLDLIVPASDFLDTTWASNGWSINDEATFLQELAVWHTIQFADSSINVEKRNVNLGLMRGQVSNDPGNSYTVVFAYNGSGNPAIQTNLYFAFAGGVDPADAGFDVGQFYS